MTKKSSHKLSAKSNSLLQNELTTQVYLNSTWSTPLMKQPLRVQREACQQHDNILTDPINILHILGRIGKVCAGRPQFYSSKQSDRGLGHNSHSIAHFGPSGSRKSTAATELLKMVVRPVEEFMQASCAQKNVEQNAPSKIVLTPGHAWQWQTQVHANGSTGIVLLPELTKGFASLQDPDTKKFGSFLVLTSDDIVPKVEYNNTSYPRIDGNQASVILFGTLDDAMLLFEETGITGGTLGRFQFNFINADTATKNIDGNYNWKLIVQKLQFLYYATHVEDPDTQIEFKFILSKSAQLKRKEADLKRKRNAMYALPLSQFDINQVENNIHTSFEDRSRCQTADANSLLLRAFASIETQNADCDADIASYLIRYGFITRSIISDNWFFNFVSNQKESLSQFKAKIGAAQTHEIMITADMAESAIHEYSLSLQTLKVLLKFYKRTNIKKVPKFIADEETPSTVEFTICALLHSRSPQLYLYGVLKQTVGRYSAFQEEIKNKTAWNEKFSSSLNSLVALGIVINKKAPKPRRGGGKGSFHFRGKNKITDPSEWQQIKELQLERFHINECRLDS